MCEVESFLRGKARRSIVSAGLDLLLVGHRIFEDALSGSLQSLSLSSHCGTAYAIKNQTR